MDRIDIPLKDQDEVVEVHLDQLPDAEDIIGILKDEETPRELYWRFSIEYYKQGQEDAFLQLVEAGLADEPFLKAQDLKRPRDLALLNSTLCNYHVQKALAAKTSDEKDLHLHKAMAKMQVSDRLDHGDPTTWLTKGHLFLAKNRLDEARNCFQVLLTKKKDAPFGLYGKAAVLFHQKDFKEALKVYQRLLKLYPNISPDPRIGIGLCFFHLNEHERALYAFQRAIERDDDCKIAKVYASVCLLNQAKRDPKSAQSKNLVLKAIEFLKQVQKADKHNSYALVYLSDIVFQKGDYDKSFNAAQNAYQNSTSKSLLALAYLHAAKAEHAREKFEEAKHDYMKALELDKDLILARFGLAQVKLERGQYKEAVEDLENVLEYQKIGQEGAKVLAFALSKLPNRREKAVEMYKDLAKSFPNDAEVHIELAQLMETVNLNECVDFYQRANELLITKGEVALPLLNNMAAALHYAGNLEEAEKAYEKALELCATVDDEETEGVSLTLRYNLGRLYEAIAEKNILSPKYYEKATKIYHDIMAVHPEYLDAKLRLGRVAEAQGDKTGASDIYKECVAVGEKNIDAWTMLANYDLGKRSYRTARNAFERILKHIDKHDKYALVALGNDKLTAARSEQKPEVRDNLYKDAVKFFDKALRYETRCAFAANGLGIALAEMGKLNEAREVFSQCREANDNVLMFQMNLAHVLVEMSQFNSAVALYETLGKKFENDVQLLLYTARAYYIMARAEKSPTAMKTCIRLVEKCVHVQPQDLALYFNLALTLQQHAQLVCDQPEEVRTTQDLEEAQKYIENAKAIFGDLKSQKSSKTAPLGFDVAMAGQREKHCDFVKSNVIRRLTQMRANEELKREKIEEMRRKRELEEIKRKEQEEEQERKREEQERQLEEERKAMYEKLIESQREMREQVEEKKKPKKKEKIEKPERKRRKKSRTTDDAEQEEDEKAPQLKGKHKTPEEVPEDILEEEEREETARQARAADSADASKSVSHTSTPAAVEHVDIEDRDAMDLDDEEAKPARKKALRLEDEEED